MKTLYVIMRGFYLALPSGNSFNFFPENALTNFMMKPYEVVDLKGEWERGVVEIFYPHMLVIPEIIRSRPASQISFLPTWLLLDFTALSFIYNKIFAHFL